MVFIFYHFSGYNNINAKKVFRVCRFPTKLLYTLQMFLLLSEGQRMCMWFGYISQIKFVPGAGR